VPLTRLVLSSRLYRSRPFGPIAQPDFVNAVAGVLTQLESAALLAALRALETALGRPARRERWGPRIIDLDLLCYAREQRSEALLTLPHPGIVERTSFCILSRTLPPISTCPGWAAWPSSPAASPPKA